MSGTLESLREAEQKARQMVEKARQEAATSRASLPRELAALEDEKNSHLARERSAAEARVRREVSSREDDLRALTAGRIEALEKTLPSLEEKAFDILREILLSGRER